MNKLYEMVPEFSSIKGKLKNTLESHLEDGFGAHMIYEDVLVPYIISLMEEDIVVNQEVIHRCFELIEVLSNSEDDETRNVAQVSFIEPLLCKLPAMKDIEKYLVGNASLELAKEIAWDRFGVDHRIDWEEAVEWHFPYQKYFGIIFYKPKTCNEKLELIYDKLYRDDDIMPGGLPQILKETVKGKTSRYDVHDLLQRAKNCLKKLRDIKKKENRLLSDSELKTLKVVTFNLIDSIKLAKAAIAKT